MRRRFCAIGIRAVSQTEASPHDSAHITERIWWKRSCKLDTDATGRWLQLQTQRSCLSNHVAVNFIGQNCISLYVSAAPLHADIAGLGGCPRKPCARRCRRAQEAIPHHGIKLRLLVLQISH